MEAQASLCLRLSERHGHSTWSALFVCLFLAKDYHWLSIPHPKRQEACSGHGTEADCHPSGMIVFLDDEQT